MSRIKTRESVKDIKVIDKAAVASERMKTALVRSKDQFENLMDDGQVTPSEYAEDMMGHSAWISTGESTLNTVMGPSSFRPSPIIFRSSLHPY
ncbi:MAG: hypothetical protein SOR87_01270 [Vescimonas coprocola]|nr:hypothetical protein [Vescimonas coprocola]